MKTIEVRSPVHLLTALPMRQHILLLLAMFACVVLVWRADNRLAAPLAVPSDGANQTLSIAQEQPAAGHAGGLPRFDGQRAYQYLRKICSFGNRMSGSDGMRLQQELLVKHFTELGAQVDYQRFQLQRHPLTGKPVPMANLIVQWRSDATERILLCAHYDTRPRPDREPNPRLRQSGVFLGANDGASGTAVLMEMGHHVKNLPDHYGLDFIFFDAEEFVFSRRDKYFLGSEWFARNYVNRPPKHRYLAGVLLDMVGDSKLSIYQETHSATWPDTRPLVQEIWGTAARLGVKEFIPRVGYEVLDDHVPLRNIAKIPVCDVIDFQYPDRSNRFWHTTADTPNRCSADSLGKVGWVLQEWLATRINADSADERRLTAP